MKDSDRLGRWSLEKRGEARAFEVARPRTEGFPSITPRMSLSFMMSSSSPSILTSVPRPLAEQHAVAGLDVERNDLAALVAGAGADGDDLALHRLFLGGIGNDDAAGGLGVFLDAAHDDAVMQRAELHGL